MHNIPQLHIHHPNQATITRWGVVDGLVFRPGDRLLLGPVPQNHLILLQPRGWGAPMFGRLRAGQIIAEPGGVIASPLRWFVAGGLRVIERRMIERKCSVQTIGLQSWRLPDGTTFNPLQLEAWLRQMGRTICDEHGVVLGVSVADACSVQPRPGWIRYVFPGVSEDVLHGPWLADTGSVDPLPAVTPTMVLARGA
ncbi:MAG: hypothetical protein AAFV53_12000 [Myxococcota bacterium]